MTEEVQFTPRLCEGDAEQLKNTTDQIQELEKIRAVISHEGWQKVMADIETERDIWLDSMSNPEKLEFKAGVLHGLRLAKEYSKKVEARLSFLYLDKQRLVELGLKNAKGDE